MDISTPFYIVKYMTEEILLSAGIDIGTTTTHLIISEIGISVSGGFGTVPYAEITSKKIVYKSPVYFTPLKSDGSIDGERVSKIISKEYKCADVTPEKLQSGAVIITGESACKSNSQDVLHHISRLAGNFISAEAGSELESLLAGKGAEADLLSRETGKLTANIDIGGGTTNISFFESGECIDTCCLNIGGRLIKDINGRLYVSDVLNRLSKGCIKEGCGINANKSGIEKICDILSEFIFSAVGFSNTPIPDYLITDHKPSCNKKPDLITLSGGVAECMNGRCNDFEYNDMGVILAKSVMEKSSEYSCPLKKSISNPIRATVIGAGQFSMEISGSTIQYSSIPLPLKNLPCVCSLDKIADTPCAFCLKGKKSPSFHEVNQLAEDIAAQSKKLLEKCIPLVIVTKEDYSKALGQCLKRKLPKDYPFLCADGIDCKSGDYIDIGSPVAGGKAVPVVVKTLVFGG